MEIHSVQERHVRKVAVRGADVHYPVTAVCCFNQLLSFGLR